MRKLTIALALVLPALVLGSTPVLAQEVSPATGDASTEYAVPQAAVASEPVPFVAGALYGTDGASLYLIDVTTGAGTLIGSHGTVEYFIGALAFDANGTLYGLSLGSSAQLYEIDTTTGAATAIGPLNIGFVFEGGLAFSPEGDLFGADQGDAGFARTFTIDTSTGAATLLGGNGQSRDLNGFTFDGNTLYAIDRVSDSLGTVSLTTGEYSVIGSTGADVGDLGAVAYDPGSGQMYASFENVFYRLNRSTGAATVIGTHDVGNITGLAFAPSAGSWAAAYQAMFSDLTLVETLRQFRDQVLAKSDRGRFFKELLYSASEEALAILQQNPHLMKRAGELVEENRAAVEAVLEGREGVIRNSDEVLSFLDAYSQESPAPLRLLASSVSRDIIEKRESGELFFGFRFANP